MKMKMKKVIIILILVLFFGLRIYSQSKNLETIPFYFDSKIVNEISDSLEIKGVDSFYVFLSKMDNNSYTYLLWQGKEKNYMIRIEDTIILITTVKDIDFLKGNYEKIAIMEKERQLKFTAPLDHDSECSYFIFKSSKISYLIESGKNCLNFVLEKCKNSQREKFISTVRQNLKVLNSSSWIVYKKYDRYKEE